jgi:hypothetical protein
LRITFDGEIPAKSALTFTVSVDGGPPQVVSGDAFAFHIGGITVSTGLWTLIAQDAKVLNVMISPDFPPVGWTGRIDDPGSSVRTVTGRLC